jgi:hypothetical protein
MPGPATHTTDYSGIRSDSVCSIGMYTGIRSMIRLSWRGHARFNMSREPFDMICDLAAGLSTRVTRVLV